MAVNMYFRAGSALLLVVLAGVVAAQDCLDYGDYFHWLGGAATDGAGRRLTVAGDLAFLAGMNDGVGILDISDPEHPRLIGDFATEGEARAVVVASDIAYVAQGSEGLQIVSVIDPEAPQVLATLDTPGLAYAVELTRQHVLVGDFYGGLQIVDVSVPEAPAIVAQVPSGFRTVDIAVEGDFAYLADDEAGVQVVDISDLTQPHPLGFLTGLGRTTAVHALAGRLYVGNATGNVRLFDLAAPGSPLPIGSAAISGGLINAISSQGSIALIGFDRYDSHGALAIVDVAAPPHLPILAQLDLVSTVTGVIWDEGRAVLSASSHNINRAILHIVDLTDLEMPEVAGTCTGTSGQAMDMTCEGDFVLAAQRGYGMQIYDVHDPAAPHAAGRFFVSGIDAVSVAVHDGIAYVGSLYDGLYIVDVADPYLPSQVGFTDLVAAPSKIALGPDWLAVKDGTHVVILDLADPAVPTWLANIAVSVRALATDGDLVHAVTANAHLRTYDLSSPATPILLADLPLIGNAVSVSVCAGRAYVAAGDDGFLIVDVTDATHPVLLGAATTPSTASRVVAGGGFAYVGCADTGLMVYDVRDPANPRPLAAAGGYVADFALGPEFASTLDGTYPHTFNVIYRQCSATTVGPGSGPPKADWSLTAVPNPFNPLTTIEYALPQPGAVALTIYDLRGRLVRSLLTSTQQDAGSQQLTWDGRDDAGAVLPSGTYLLRLEAGGTERSLRVALIR